MLKDIKKLTAEINELGYFDILVDGIIVSEMIPAEELAGAIDVVMKDEAGKVAELLKEYE